MGGGCGRGYGGSLFNTTSEKRGIDALSLSNGENILLNLAAEMRVGYPRERYSCM